MHHERCGDARWSPRSAWRRASALLDLVQVPPRPSLPLIGGLAVLLTALGGLLAFHSVAPAPRTNAPAALTSAVVLGPAQPAATVQTADAAPAPSPTIVPALSFPFAPGPTPAPFFTYVVQPGDSLTLVAARFGVSLDTLAALNDLAPSAYLLIGQLLQVPRDGSTPAPPRTATDTRGSATPPPSSGAAASTDFFTYVVQPGDSLTLVAARFGVSLDTLAALNDLAPSAYLLIGQQLRIPGTRLGPAPLAPY